MLVDLGGARRNLLAQRRQVTAQGRRRGGLVGACGRSGGSFRSIEDFGAQAVSDDPVRDELRLAVTGGLEPLDVNFDLVINLGF